MMTLWPRRGCACQAARRPDPITADMSSSPYGGCFRPTKCQGNRVGGIKESNLRNRTMHPTRALQLCALPMALTLLLGPARAQAPLADAPLDLSTPEPDSGKLKGMTPFADRASALDWNGKAGIDYSKPSI